MKKFLVSKKGIALFAAIVAVAVGAFGAYAYFTSTGTGTGTATVGTDSAWTLGQTGSTGPALYPDSTIGTGNIQTKAYSITNPSAGNQLLTDVEVKIAEADGSPWSSGSCDKDDFSVGGAAVGATYTDSDSAADFEAGETVSDSVTVQMIDDNTNQDDCKNAIVPLHFFAS
jgi:hypothetical protein